MSVYMLRVDKKIDMFIENLLKIFHEKRKFELLA